MFSGYCSNKEMQVVFLSCRKYCGFLIRLKAYVPANSTAQTGLSLDDVMYVQLKINWNHDIWNREIQIFPIQEKVNMNRRLFMSHLCSNPSAVRIQEYRTSTLVYTQLTSLLILQLGIFILECVFANPHFLIKLNCGFVRKTFLPRFLLKCC